MKGFFESIDLSHNEITKLENFSILKNVKSLILSNNRISKIGICLNNFKVSFGESMPNLVSLILSNNKLTDL